MIEITREPNADSRTAKVELNKEDLRAATDRHIGHVYKGLDWFASLLHEAGEYHDKTKKIKFDKFFEALKSGKIKESDWYQSHITKERHHLISNVPDDVNLIDVLEHLVDCVMAGLSRSGEIYDIDLSNEVLQKAHKNTVELLKKNIKVKKSDDILDQPIHE